MLGYYDGFENGPARPITRQWYTLKCEECGVYQTHHKEDKGYRCVICSAVKNGGANDEPIR